MKQSKRQIALIILALVSTLVGANGQEESNHKQWYNRVATWLQGEPWSFQDKLPMTHTKYLIQCGQIGILDSYLSPIAHNGYEIKASFLTDFLTPQQEKHTWHIYQDLSLSAASLENNANRSNMYHLAIDYAVGPSWRPFRRNGWAIDLAPLLALSFGGNIKMNNTNNIGNVKAFFGLEGLARIRYQTPWKVVPLGISYSAQIPLLLGVFHPEYGQSYYDYVSGENGASIAFRLASPHNTRAIKQRLLLDIPLRSLTCTLGVEHYHFRQMINDTDYRMGGWSLLIGLSIDAFSLSGNSAKSSSQVQSSYYQ